MDHLQFLRRIAAALLLLGLLGCFASVYAQSVHSYVTPTPTGGKLVTGALNSVGNAAFSANSSGAVAVGEAVTVRVGAAANASTMTATRVFPWGAVARVAAKSLPVIATGVALKQLWDDLRCTATGGTITCDPGQAPESVGQYKCYSSNNGVFYSGGTPYAACVNGWNLWYAAHLASGKTIVMVSAFACSANSCSGQIKVGGGVEYYSSAATLTQVQQCIGGTSPGLDGKCPSGASEPLSDQAAADKFGAAVPKTNAERVIRDALGHGVDIAPYADPGSLAGPATVPGPVKDTTTTAPDGSPQTSTERTVYNISYGGDTFSYTTTITNTAPDGTTTETTEQKPEEQTQCEKTPNIAACAELDTPDAPELEDKQVQVNVTPMSGWGAGTASCPAPRQLTVQGQPVEVSFDLLCQFASGIRFAVVGSAGILAALIMLGAGKVD